MRGGGKGEVRGVLMAFWVRKGMGQREGEGGAEDHPTFPEL